MRQLRQLLKGLLMNRKPKNKMWIPIYTPEQRAAHACAVIIAAILICSITFPAVLAGQCMPHRPSSIDHSTLRAVRMYERDTKLLHRWDRIQLTIRAINTAPCRGNTQ
jgi:hypothetical protein